MIISIDFDAFYCGVEQHFDPSLVETPFIVYQKNVIATLSYPARQLGLKKLGLVSEAVAKFPTIKLVNGESLARYRSEGKELWKFIKELVEGSPVERLGLEEMWIDLSEVIDYNIRNLEVTGLMDYIRDQYERGGEVDDDAEGVNLYLSTSPETSPVYCEDFMFNLPGRTFPGEYEGSLPQFFGDDNVRTYIAAHLAFQIKDAIMLQKGYSCSIGVAHNKTLAKMVGSVNKPNGLTTLVSKDHAQRFLDPKPVSKIPYFGHKSVSIILEDYRKESQEMGDPLTVQTVRTSYTKERFNELLGSAVGDNLWKLLHGVDKSKVSEQTKLPAQVTIEDTYKKNAVTTEAKVRSEMTRLLCSLFRQAITDLIDIDTKSWLGFPQNVRLTIREHITVQISYHQWSRKSKSIKVRPYVYKLTDMIDNSTQQEALAERIVDDDLYGAFRTLLPPNAKPMNLQLINIGFTKISDS